MAAMATFLLVSQTDKLTLAMPIHFKLGHDLILYNPSKANLHSFKINLQKNIKTCLEKGYNIQHNSVDKVTRKRFDTSAFVAILTL